MIVEAGVAELSCARALTAAGRAVVVLDRGRRPGGRATGSRPVGEGLVPVGIGPAGFAVTDPAFHAEVERWAARGVVGAPQDGWWTSACPPGLVEAIGGDLDVRPETTAGRVGPGPTVDGTAAAR